MQTKEGIRQLAAVLFADIAGYTALMQKDEVGALSGLRQFKDDLETHVPVHKGRIVQFYGDGCLVVFSNAVDAVRCAMVLQQGFQKKPEVPVRMGIHMGDVVFRDDNAFGDSINIASRIESMGVPGAILFSEGIKDQVRNQNDLTYTALGDFEFKNVGEPQTVYALTNQGFNVPDKNKLVGKFKEGSHKGKNTNMQRAAGAVVLIALALLVYWKVLSPSETGDGSIQSLAIFPFENKDNDPDITYLADGIPENLINRLSALPDVKVFSRNATFTLRDSSGNIPKIRDILGVDAVFVGQIHKYGDQVVLNCQLIDARTNDQIWGQRIKTSVESVFELEDSLVSSLVSPLRIQLLHAGATAPGLVNVDPAAYSEFLRGRHLSYGSTSEEAEKALEHFREAIRIDPQFAPAYAAIANEKIVQALFSTATRSEIFDEARTAVQSAIAIDPNLADAYLSDGAIKFYGDWDFKGAEASYRKALELNPNDANNYIRYSAMLVAVGKFDKAIELADKAVLLDPVSISSLHNLGWVNLVAGRFTDSEEAFERALELHPNWIWGHIKKAYAHVFQGECDEAQQLANRAEELMRDGWGSELLQITLGFINYKCGNTEKMNQVINRFLAYVDVEGIKDPFTLAFMYYLKGDFEKAFEWEGISIAERSPSAYMYNIRLFHSDEFFDDPRHQAILKEMGFQK